MDCIFCQIARFDTEGQVIRDWGRVVVFEPLSPVTPGHLLVVPKMHVAHAGVNPAVTAETFGVAAREATGPGFNLITSAGPEATQTVFHLHVHIVPRRKDDGLLLPWGGPRG
jgi:histidine triad (HIT) family protein